ncbi:cytochrome c [Geomonas paludis]|uniref:Cytochrome c n=1 Tax=Geomonas paludis TaxID=2740185 RepID=A0A6V8MX23_9BACT|nr:cytochrome c [Geomonas paludis]
MLFHSGVRRALPFLLTLVLCGCDPVTRHQVLVSVLDGYPTLPPVEDLCRDSAAQAVEAALKKQEVVAAAAGQAPVRSTHLPYLEKRCNDCHKADKSASDAGDEGGLLKSPEELCFMCHKGLLNKPFHHGPAAVGECLACHLPHDSENAALLVLGKDGLCKKCHTEARAAARMHAQFSDKNMPCINCHDPHSGDTRFFLK